MSDHLDSGAQYTFHNCNSYSLCVFFSSSLSLQMKVHNKHIAHKLPINNINLKYLNETTAITQTQYEKKKTVVLIIIITCKQRE